MKGERNLEYYLSLKYPYTIEEEEEDGEKVYVTEIPDLPGCGAEGSTLEEARKNLEEAKAVWIEESWKRKLSIPEPSKEYSGRILLRIPPALHGQLNKHARQGGLSLNQFIRNLLETRLDLSKISERLDRIEHEIQSLKESSPITISAAWPFYPVYSSGEPVSTMIMGNLGKSMLTGSSGKIQNYPFQYIAASLPKDQCVEPSDEEGEEIAA